MCTTFAYNAVTPWFRGIFGDPNIAIGTTCGILPFDVVDRVLFISSLIMVIPHEGPKVLFLYREERVLLMIPLHWDLNGLVRMLFME
jgi:hypothetical protein